MAAMAPEQFHPMTHAGVFGELEEAAGGKFRSSNVELEADGLAEIPNV